MAWTVEDRRQAIEDTGTAYLTDDLKAHLSERYIPRYPTKRAVLLPGLHLIQHRYGYIPMRAMQELAEFLEVAPAEALDTATFYEEYWLKPKGQYLIGVCRSLACELCGSRQITEHLRRKLGVEPGETTADKRFTLIEMECLGACGTAPVALCNEVLYEELTVEMLDQIIAKLPADPHDYKDPTVNWPLPDDHLHGHDTRPDHKADAGHAVPAIDVPSKAVESSVPNDEKPPQIGECDEQSTPRVLQPPKPQ